MLTREENDLITRTGPGTPMGILMRRYWIPALFSDQLPSPDCPPVRVKLLGEKLVAFRTTDGTKITALNVPLPLNKIKYRPKKDASGIRIDSFTVQHAF